jgi:uncharacterized protein (DUF58 family)
VSGPRQRWSAFLRRLRPPRTLKATKSGRTYLILTVGVGLAALNTGNNLLYLVLGLLLSLLIVSGVLSERCLWRVSVRRIGSDAAFAGEPFAFRWSVKAQGGPLFALTFDEEPQPGSSSLTGQGKLGYLAKGEERVLRARMSAPRRGPVKLTGIRVSTTFPLGLFIKTRVFDESSTLWVYPRKTNAPPVAAVHDTSQIGEQGNALKKDGAGDLLGLRELQTGEDARRIHWMKSAAAGKLLRTEREREERKTVVLELAVSQDSPASLDAPCEILAAQAHALLSTGFEVGLEAGPLRLRPAAGSAQELRILKALAMAGYGDVTA